MSAATRTPAAKIEYGHVLFVDIVGWSRLLHEDQRQYVEELIELVRGTPEFQGEEAAGTLIQVPSGDGMALVFLRDVEAPARCALMLARAVRERPHLPLRMGIHSGPVSRFANSNGTENVSGNGINNAKRVMDLGDAGHILMTEEYARCLLQSKNWQGALWPLGAAEVKHGEVLRVYTLSKQGLGSLTPPAKLLQGAVDAEAPAPPEAQLPGKRAVTPMHLALLYKREARPDVELLQFLETSLREAGHRVFVDRHLEIGVEWAQEIVRQVQEADAVIPLVSEAAGGSEMLAYEIKKAYEAYQEHRKPRILPVRIGFEGRLPDELGSILDRFQYTLWKGEPDNESLLREIEKGLVRPDEPPSAHRDRAQEREPAVEPDQDLAPLGGAVPPRNPFYVVRREDQLALQPLKVDLQENAAANKMFILIRGARQVGKTSLLVRCFDLAREAGSRTVHTDFQSFSERQLQSTDTLYQALAESLVEQLDLDVEPGDVWDPQSAPNTNFQKFLRRHVLQKEAGHLVWGLDEVDRLFTYAYATEVFGMFRAWFNRRATDVHGTWQRLTVVYAYATEAHLFIRDLNQSPFNVGEKIELKDFDYEQLAALNARYGSPLKTEVDVNRLRRLVNGHPYLVQRGLYTLQTQDRDLAAFEARAHRDDGPYGDHLRRILTVLSQDREMCEVVRGVLRGQGCPSEETFLRLQRGGVMTGTNHRDARFRCDLYERYLEHHLLGGR